MLDCTPHTVSLNTPVRDISRDRSMVGQVILDEESYSNSSLQLLSNIFDLYHINGVPRVMNLNKDEDKKYHEIMKVGEHEQETVKREAEGEKNGKDKRGITNEREERNTNEEEGRKRKKRTRRTMTKILMIMTITTKTC